MLPVPGRAGLPCWPSVSSLRTGPQEAPSFCPRDQQRLWLPEGLASCLQRPPSSPWLVHTWLCSTPGPAL